MSDLCRLCAQTEDVERMHEISDPALNIEQMLVDCCRWNSIRENGNHFFPQKVCMICVGKLEQSWEFAESVAAAQHELLYIVCSDNMKAIDGMSHDMDNDSVEFDESAIVNCDEFVEGYDFVSDIDTKPTQLEEGNTMEYGAMECYEFNKNVDGMDKAVHIIIETRSARKRKHSLSSEEHNNRQMNGTKKQVKQSESEALTVKRKRKLDKSEVTSNESNKSETTSKSLASKSCVFNDFFNDDENQGAQQSGANDKNKSKQMKWSSEKSKQLEAKTRVVKNGKINESKQAKRLETPEKLQKVKKEDEFQVKDTLLELLLNEDRNDDGTVKSDAIQRLELKNWLLLQYQCGLCNECLGTHHAFKWHFIREHPDVSKMRNRCSFCTNEKRTYRRRSSLCRHIIKCHFPYLKYW